MYKNIYNKNIYNKIKYIYINILILFNHLNSLNTVLAYPNAHPSSKTFFLLISYSSFNNLISSRYFLSFFSKVSISFYLFYKSLSIF